MAAFQQRRQQQQRDHLSEASPPLVDEPSTSSDLAADDSAVLLFGSRTSDNQATSASWSVIRPPRSVRTTSFTWSVRTTSFTSSVGTSAYAATDTSGYGDDGAASSSLGSPLSFTQASLLPAHAGDGVFLTATASAGSLVMSDDTATEDSSAGDLSERDGRHNATTLFPSIYADLNMVDSSSSDDGRGGTAFSAYSHISRRGGGDLTTGGESFVSEASEWALTEAALSTHRALAGDHVTPRLTRTENEEGEQEGSVGLTSGSENEDHAAQPRQQRSITTTQAQAAASWEKEEQDWAQSAHALSAGFLPASRRPRRAPPPSSSYTREPQAPPITVLLPRPGSASLRSLSPAGSVSARSRRSSSSLGGGAAASGGGVGGFKRRHRQAGTGRSSTSQKRSVASAANLNTGADDRVGGRASLSGQALFLEQVAREEENRARRMTAILEQRREEVRLREAEAQVLFGHAIRNYMSIDPVSFALLAEAAADSVPLATIECTPTPSRAHSPPHFGGDDGDDDVHGAEAFTAHAVREGRFAGGVRAPVEEEEDSGAETETEHDSDRAGDWTRYSLATPIGPSRVDQKKKRASPPTRSRSTSELANLFESSSSSVATTLTKTMGTFSPITGSGLTARGVHSPTLHRRSSSFSGQHHHFPHFHHEEDGRPLSHEERIMLGDRPSSSSSMMESALSQPALHGNAAPWGGDVDSFELALNYWKRMWRRLRGTTTLGGGATSTATAGAPTVAHSSSDDSNDEVRSAAESSTSSAGPVRRKQKTFDLLVPEARVGRV